MTLWVMWTFIYLPICSIDPFLRLRIYQKEIIGNPHLTNTTGTGNSIVNHDRFMMTLFLQLLNEYSFHKSPMVIK